MFNSWFNLQFTEVIYSMHSYLYDTYLHVCVIINVCTKV